MLVVTFITHGPLKAEKPNKEGLTFNEWICAADPVAGDRLMLYPKMSHLRQCYPKYVNAWLAGEDPTDWRAALPPPIAPPPYALCVHDPEGVRGRHALSQGIVDAVKAIPARQRAKHYVWGDYVTARLEVGKYGRELSVTGNSPDEAAENLKLVLLDILEQTGRYRKPEYRAPYSEYEVKYQLIPLWEARKGLSCRRTVRTSQRPAARQGLRFRGTSAPAQKGSRSVRQRLGLVCSAQVPHVRCASARRSKRNPLCSTPLT